MLDKLIFKSKKTIADGFIPTYKDYSVGAFAVELCQFGVHFDMAAIYALYSHYVEHHPNEAADISSIAVEWANIFWCADKPTVPFFNMPLKELSDKQLIIIVEQGRTLNHILVKRDVLPREEK